MPAALPAAPNTPVVTLSSSTQITLEWTQDPSTDGGSSIFDYIVYFDNGVSQNQEVAIGSTANQLTHTQTGLSQGTPYKFWVAAKNFIGVGPLSESVI